MLGMGFGGTTHLTRTRAMQVAARSSKLPSVGTRSSQAETAFAPFCVLEAESSFGSSVLPVFMPRDRAPRPPLRPPIVSNDETKALILNDRVARSGREQHNGVIR